MLPIDRVVWNPFNSHLTMLVLIPQHLSIQSLLHIRVSVNMHCIHCDNDIMIQGHLHSDARKLKKIFLIVFLNHRGHCSVDEFFSCPLHILSFL